MPARGDERGHNMPIVIYHDGQADFPHGAGPSDEGWYFYPEGIAPEPYGPFETEGEAQYLAEAGNDFE